METDDAGLALVDYIRTELKNETVRIILRTGQPGQAPERRVIVDYDINDYKAKTELTADKLFTALTAALRSYQQLQRMVETRRGLEMIIDGASTLYDFKSMQLLAEGVLTQIASLLNVDAAASWSCARAAGRRRNSPFSPAPAATAILPGWRARTRSSPICARRSTARSSTERMNSTPSCRCSTSAPRAGARSWCCWRPRPLSATDRALVEVFCSRLSVAFDNVVLYEQLNEANVRLEERVRERTRALTSANERLTSQWARLRRANEFKNEVLGTVAHDLRNPLSVILGRAEMMNELAAMNPVPLDKLATSSAISAAPPTS